MAGGGWRGFVGGSCLSGSYRARDRLTESMWCLRGAGGMAIFAVAKESGQG